MSSRTRSRKQASIGSNHSLRRPTPISASEPRTGNFVLLLVMAWSPPAHNAGNVRVSAPGDYATFNSNHTPDGTDRREADERTPLHSYEVLGFGVANGAPAVRIDRMAPDNYWFGARPQILLDRRGAGVDGMIARVRDAVGSYRASPDRDRWSARRALAGWTDGRRRGPM